MAEAIQINASNGIPGIPAGATNVSARDGSGTQHTYSQQAPGSLPVDALLGIQSANTQPAAPAAVAPAGVDAAEFAAFQAWKANQSKPAPAVAPVTQAVAPVAATSSIDAVALTGNADPVLGSMVGLLTATVPGLDLTRAIGNALTYGDAKLIDTAYLNEVGKEKAAFLVQYAQGVVDHALRASSAAEAAVINTAGNKESWDAATAAFNRAAPQHLKQYVGYALKSGDQSQIVAAAQTVVEFAKSSGLVPVFPQGQVGASGGAPGSAQGLSKADFQKELAKLDRNGAGFEQQRGELFGRRNIGIQLGL